MSDCMKRNYTHGVHAENHLASKLSDVGLPFAFAHSWYDFMVNGHKVEVKSCRIVVRNGKYPTVGRFDFTKPANREKQHKENIWICFIVRHGGQFIIFGFVPARACKKKRYISLYEASKLRCITFEEWVKVIN